MILFLLGFALNLYAEQLVIHEVDISCGNSKFCASQKVGWKRILGKYKNVSELKETLRLFLLNKKIIRFHYKIFSEDNKNKFMANYVIRPLMEEIRFETNSNLNFEQLTKLLPLREGAYYDSTKLETCQKIIKNFLSERGYKRPRVNYQIILRDNKATLVFQVKLGPPQIIKKIELLGMSKNDKKTFFIKLKDFIGRPYNIKLLKVRLNKFRIELFGSGHFASLVKLLPEETVDNNEVILRIHINLGKKYLFLLEGNRLFSRQKIMNFIRGHNQSMGKVGNKEELEIIIKNEYAKLGYYLAEVKISEFVKEGKDVVINQIHITENKKSKVESINFKGASYFTKKEILELYDKKASILAGRGFLDKKYLNDFQGLLENKYMENGLVQVRVQLLKIEIKKGKAYIVYNVHEGNQTIIQKLSWFGIDSQYQAELEKRIKNRVGLPFDPMALVSDFTIIEKYLMENGLIFATISRKRDETIVYYSQGNYVDVNFVIQSGPKAVLEEIIITGILNTKSQIVLREIFLNKGDLITPNKLSKIKKRLNSLGLFSQINLEVLPGRSGQSKAVLLVELRERQAGLIQLSPGYRSDLGAKLSFSVGHSNLAGMNRSLSFKGQLNQRLDGRTLDAQRPEVNSRKVEYSGKINYVEPYLMNWPIYFQSTLANTRRRYFSFDADILRLSTGISKQWTDRVGTSLTYQLESITQENALDRGDNGHFRIGGIVPALEFDYRDNAINPRSGFYNFISLERAAPQFFSQSSGDKQVNYMRIVNRNKGYIPWSNGTIAFSLSLGMEENLARENGQKVSRIPRIKVFRLSGVDKIRGFRDSEINRLPNGEKISDIIVDGKAYFITAKFEPRFLIDDNTILGVFLDAGRIFVNSFRPLSLRTAAGVSLKYLTPVGSLDFDYGIKLKRARLPDGTLERPGEFYVSIGFF